MPIIKCCILVSGNSLQTDISLSGSIETGVLAAQKIAACIRMMPPIRPLMFVLKRLLKVSARKRGQFKSRQSRE